MVQFEDTVFEGIIQLMKESLTKQEFTSIDHGEYSKESIQKIADQISELHTKFKKNKEFIEDFRSYKLEEFKRFGESLIKHVLKQNFGLYLPKGDFNRLVELFYHHVKSRNFLDTWTGLVFSGFGEKQIYPSSVSIKVGEVIDNRMRFFQDLDENINDENTGSIMPFAQRDVIDTIISGINPDLDRIYLQSFESFLKKYNQIIHQIVSKVEPKIAEKIDNLSTAKIVEEFENSMDKVKRQYHIHPTVDTVALLSKEDLAEMAESLIYLTYLKRRISFDEESVGGPVDVALISKGDGFVWIKRKHYFKPELNPQFFKNYLK